MTVGQIITIIQDAIWTIMLVSSPLLIVGLVVGVLVSVFQATTQINEQTLVFVPKIASIFITLIICGPWMITKLMEFADRLFVSINMVTR